MGDFFILLDRLTMLRERGRAALAASAPDERALATLRQELSDMLGGFATAIHRRVYEPCLTAGERERIVARRIKADIIYLQECHRAFAGRWRFAAIGRDWTRYRVEAAELLDLLGDSIARALAEALRLHCARGCGGCADRLGRAAPMMAVGAIRPAGRPGAPCAGPDPFASGAHATT